MAEFHRSKARVTANRKELALVLYTEQNKTQAEIASLLGVSQPNIAKYAKRGNWKEVKSGLSSTMKGTNLARLNAQLSRLNQSIIDRDGIPTKEESGIIRKLTGAIKLLDKRQQTKLKELSEAGKEFVEYLLTDKPEKAVEFLELWDGFIQSRVNR